MTPVVTARTACAVVRPILEPYMDDELIEQMCRAHDLEQAHQMGEPSPWREDLARAYATEHGVKAWMDWRRDRLEAMRAALREVWLIK